MLAGLFGYAQGVPVSGKITDKAGAPMAGATVVLLNSKDSSVVTGTSAGDDGAFVLSADKKGAYILKAIFMGYRPLFRPVGVGGDPVSLGSLKMESDAKKLSEVVVQATELRAEQKGDTTQFHADAYKTHPDATAEDLVKKMPGVTSDNNGVKVNGEDVKKVLVDGKPFFGDDPNASLKNLPAEIIDKVQVFDKASDQAQFTGFQDGDSQKTINLITKKGRNNGQFGKIYAGYGTDDRYNGGAVLNSFSGKRRISLLLLSNNINQQNFSISDIMGVMSNSGSQGGGGGPMGGGGGQGGNGGSGSAASNLLTGQQSGITATQSAGLNYTDSWGKKINVSGSYFFNYTDNKNQSDIVRNYFTGNRLIYQQGSTAETKNQNQRFNFRFEYDLDSSNKITIVPSLNYQKNNQAGSLSGSNTVADNAVISKTNTRSAGNNEGYDFSDNILYQHKFGRQGRTVSLALAMQLTEKNGDGSYYSGSTYYNDNASTLLDQQYGSYSNSKKISTTLAYTEPVGRNAQLMVTYNPSYTQSETTKGTRDRDPLAGNYTHFNAALSNRYNNVYQTQKGGLSYRLKKGKLNFNLGADAQYAMLNGAETFPVSFGINKAFTNILPNARFNYKFSASKNLNINYRSNTSVPGVTQLQNVLDVSNPLQVRSGNINLRQTFENNLTMRLGSFNLKTSRNFFMFFTGNYTNDYISNATYILRTDTTIQGYAIHKGSQLTKPVNVNDYWSARSMMVYSFPVKAIKSNLNLNAGLGYIHTPTLINDRMNNSGNYTLSGGAYLGSNVSKNLDFSLSYNGSYNIVQNTLQTQSNNSYFTHTATFKINWIFMDGFVINTDLNQTLYSGLSQNYNQNFFLWNAYLGYKFLKNRALEAKVSVFDLLNQNRSISRTITGTYTEDSNTKVLKQYFMFTLTYTIRNFKNGAQPPATEPEKNPFMRNGMPPMHPGMPPPGGG